MPGVMPSLVRAIRNEKLLTIVGALTPTEVFQALECSADMVQVFPVELGGGADYVYRLKSHFPELDLVAAGGADLENLHDFFKAGATMVVVGEDIARPEWMENRDFESIEKRAAEIAAAAAELT